MFSFDEQVLGAMKEMMRGTARWGMKSGWELLLLVVHILGDFLRSILYGLGEAET